jgi:hypothetical protein
MSQPPDPDPSSALAAPIAAMLQEWKELWALVRKWTDESEEEERATEATAWAILLREFLDRHRVALASPTYARWDFPSKAAEQLQQLADTCRAMQQAEATLLQKVANRAEAHQAQNLEILDRLDWLEGLSDEEWEAREDRMELYPELEFLRAQRDAMLGTLPIDQRRKWEARLRPE